MKRKPRGESGRSTRRRGARDAERLLGARERLFALEPGGTPENAIEVQSPSVIEVHATRHECPRCAGRLLVLEQAAVTREGQRLREARLVCRDCGVPRSMWFRLVSPSPN